VRILIAFLVTFFLGMIVVLILNAVRVARHRREMDKIYVEYLVAQKRLERLREYEMYSSQLERAMNRKHKEWRGDGEADL